MSTKTASSNQSTPTAPSAPAMANPAPLGLLGFGMTTCLLPFKGIEAAGAKSMGFYLGLWCVFTLFMFIGTLKHNRASQVVFGSLTVLFFLLSLANFTGAESIHTIAGYVGMFCGASAIYNSMGQVLNQEFKKTILPL